MGFLNRVLALTFILLILTSLIVLSITPVEVQAVSKPSVPEFSVKFVDYSYDVSPITTTTTDPYTGEKITTTTPGYHIDNRTIEVVIRNQPFTPYTENGVTYYLYYIVQSKGRFSEDWSEWGSTVQTKNPYGGGFWPSSEYSQGSTVSRLANYRPNDQVDFRVEAVIGHYVPDSPDHMFPMYWFETDVSSGWSKTQTFTMPGESSSGGPSQTAIPSENLPATPDNNQPQTPNFVFHPLFLVGVGALLSGIVAAVVLIFTKHYIAPQTSIKQQSLKTPYLTLASQ